MKKLFYILLFLFTAQSVKSTHLVGGEMTYERIGGNTIRVTLIVYRDDLSTNGNPPPNNTTPLDPSVVVSFFGANNNFLEAIEYDLSFDEIIPPVVEPCQDVNPNVRTQRGYYIFDVNLNTINNYNPNAPITIMYARCCRNGAINNLANPGSEGFTVSVEVPPANIINDSPTFDDFEQYLCSAREKLVDFSATDADGDSLYYYLCDPLRGLDQNPPIADAFDLNNFGNTYVNYGPPYNSVQWAAGYSATNPFGGAISLNGNTGLMTVTPSTTGIFTMRVCVEEYRNGVYLNTISRDFQYVVTPCDFPDISIAIDPNIPQDPITGLYTIDADCNEGTINFNLANNIDIVDYEWDFGDPTTTADVSTLQNPSYFYSDTGTYIVTVIGYAEDGCADTSQGLVVFYPIFEPGYMFVDSCLNQEVEFFDTSFSTSGNLDSWTWNFGDPGSNTDTSQLQNPTYEYSSAGTFTASLVVTTDKGCIDTVYNDITIHPLPEPDYDILDPLCIGDTIRFDNTSTIQSGNIASFSWDINGDNYNSQDLSLVFNTPGVYPVQLYGISDLGCTDTITDNFVVNDLPNIMINAQTPVCPNTNSQINASGGVTYVWETNPLLSNTNISNPIASMQNTPSTFYVEVTDTNQCVNNDSVFIDLFALPSVDAGEDTSVCLNAANVISFNTSVPLQATGGVSYQWSPAAGLTSTNTANTIASPTTSTMYTVLVTDTNNCQNTDSVQVVVLNPALELISVEVDSMCLGDTVVVDVLELGNVTSYTWSPANFITDPSVREPGFFPPLTQDYILETVNYCYLDRDTVTIEVVAPQDVDAGPLDSICLGDPPYQLDAQPSNYDFYLWTTTDPSISDNSIPNPTVAPITDTWYYIFAVDSIGSLGCESEDSVEILVHNLPDLQLNYPANYPGYVCLGDDIVLEAISFDGEDFQWSANNASTIVFPNNAISSTTPIDTTMFYHTVTNSHGCSTTDSIQVDVQLPVIAEITGDSVMCIGFNVDLEASGGLYYQWSPDSIFSNPTFYLTQANPDTTITVSVEVSNDCFSDVAFHDIVVYPLPAVDAGEDITINRDEFGFLNGSGAGLPLWYTEDKTFEGIVSNYNVFDPEVSPFMTTNYVLEIEDSLTGCRNYDTATVFVEVLTLVAFPTGFSPNGNGVNDFARIIKYLNIEKLVYLSIYDRWGEEIFRTDELSQGWDGTFKGEPCEIGTYMWVIRAVTKDQETITRKGNITLIR